MNKNTKRRTALIRKHAKALVAKGLNSFQGASNTLLAENGARVADGNRENTAFRYCGI